MNTNYRVETSRDPARPYFLRIYEEQAIDGARLEAETLLHLASRGVPCTAPILRLDGERIGQLAGKPAALFAWCDGTMRCQASVSVRDAWQVGAALARIHVAGGERWSGRAGRFGPAELRLRLPRIAAASDPTLAAWAEPLGRALDANEARRRKDLPKGLVHGDLFRDNILWDEAGAITTLLDFESAFVGTFAFDLMVTILSWCVGDALRPELARAMVSGYESVRELTLEERDGLYGEACYAALRFSITRITDFAMRANTLKDYRRFIMRYQTLEQMGHEGLARILFDDGPERAPAPSGT
ncbi:homoserine kinase [Pendulispora albinea]|uniref:Homoserine kinase n=1 Tax=Pendulispora albinea TaxID=2741071 RepID=A0ABZ2LR16_9BACT